MKTLQETFDIVLAHARKQKCHSRDSAGICRYRQDGKMCFAGPLIPDDKYDPSFETHAVWTMHGKAQNKVSILIEDEGHNVDFVGKLQDIHDGHEVEEWEKAFQDLAIRFNLIYTAQL